MRAIITLTLALVAGSASGQSLIHRYSFNGNANDSVGTAHGTVIGNVTLSAAWGVNGVATFAGGTSASAPGYIGLPVSTVADLRNCTIEIFTTNFDIPREVYGQAGGYFQALFSAGTSYGNQTNYLILAANRSGTGIGVGARSNGVAETVVAGVDPLPVWPGNHVVHMVCSGFGGVGSTGTLTIYLDGAQLAQGQTRFSFAAVASGPGGLTTVGIGGGSPFNDPTFRGSMCEVRIYDGALSAAQILANVNAGPAVLGFTPPYTLREAGRALQIAGGVGLPATGYEAVRLNVDAVGDSAAVIDTADAVRIVRKATGLDANP